MDSAYKTFLVTSAEGKLLKFTIWKRETEEASGYFATFVNTQLDSYQKLPRAKQQEHHGIQIFNRNQNLLFYSSPATLEKYLRGIGYTFIEEVITSERINTIHLQAVEAIFTQKFVDEHLSENEQEQLLIAKAKLGKEDHKKAEVVILKLYRQFQANIF